MSLQLHRWIRHFFAAPTVTAGFIGFAVGITGSDDAQAPRDQAAPDHSLSRTARLRPRPHFRQPLHLLPSRVAPPRSRSAAQSRSTQGHSDVTLAGGRLHPRGTDWLSGWKVTTLRNLVSGTLVVLTPPAAAESLFPASAPRRKTSDTPETGGSPPTAYPSSDARPESCPAQPPGLARFRPQSFLPEQSPNHNDTRKPHC